jgi:MFS family permease
MDGRRSADGSSGDARTGGSSGADPSRLDLWSRRPEVAATYLAEVGTSVLFIGGGVFVNVAILDFANKAAGCVQAEPSSRKSPDLSASSDPNGWVMTTKDGSVQECDLTLYGLQPSSIVPLISTVAGLASALFMPYVGALIDHTSRRRQFGASMAALATASMLGLTLLHRRTWLPVSVVCISSGALAYYGHSLARWAYVREIVSSDAEVASVVTGMRIWQLLAQLFYLGAVLAITAPAGLSDLVTARVAQGLSSALAAPLLIHAWRTYLPRPAKHVLPPGQSLWLAGVRQLRRTLVELGTESPGLRQLWLVSAIASAPTVAFTPISVTYITHQLALSNSQVAVFAGLTLLSAVPGALLYRALSLCLGHRSCLLCAICWIGGVVVLFATVLRTPRDQELAFALAVPTGMCALSRGRGSPSLGRNSRHKRAAHFCTRRTRPVARRDRRWLSRTGLRFVHHGVDAGRARGGALGLHHLCTGLAHMAPAHHLCCTQRVARRYAAGDGFARHLLRDRRNPNAVRQRQIAPASALAARRARRFGPRAHGGTGKRDGACAAACRSYRNFESPRLGRAAADLKARQRRIRLHRLLRELRRCLPSAALNPPYTVLSHESVSLSAQSGLSNRISKIR